MLVPMLFFCLHWSKSNRIWYVNPAFNPLRFAVNFSDPSSTFVMQRIKKTFWS